ncbi:hypothetical protein CROQUDRAFT_129569 [Cronartium quercuum f. sp. fusiforme G11]|uniref:Uncharacterized protein n=1 Tax=Cronartium quercuum f. sp. fusiforme G11 TaxID=708437 RepID=A0A9P6THU5_9BASI|nr:hypothetical protein CROQUDRAFT_129569 [Cronartium quercuum f. sp. fusiforme G11]
MSANTPVVHPPTSSGTAVAVIVNHGDPDTEEVEDLFQATSISPMDWENDSYSDWSADLVKLKLCNSPDNPGNEVIICSQYQPGLFSMADDNEQADFYHTGSKDEREGGTWTSHLLRTGQLAGFGNNLITRLRASVIQVLGTETLVLTNFEWATKNLKPVTFLGDKITILPFDLGPSYTYQDQQAIARFQLLHNCVSLCHIMGLSAIPAPSNEEPGSEQSQVADMSLSSSDYSAPDTSLSNMSISSVTKIYETIANIHKFAIT